ncbi:MAG: PEP-CTERM sorting domain-containing protein, partial [Opitutales bacterium]|nr:PEP-CTERM sorting domain-containing protein [Opitutales bacterium]
AESVQLDSTFSYWISGADQDKDVSAWKSVLGKTATEVEELKFDGTQQIVYDAGQAASADYSLLNKTLSLKSLYGSEQLIESSYYLNSYSFIGRADSSSRPSGIVLAVFSESNLVGFSSNVAYSDTSSVYGSVTFSNIFSYVNGAITSESLILDTASSYEFKILNATARTAGTAAVATIDGVNYYSQTLDANKLGYGEFKMYWGSSTGGKLDGLTNNADYKKPVVSLSVSPVPEPSAFGMLAGLGALVLVASRRRRR